MKRNRTWWVTLIMPVFFLLQFVALHHTESRFIERMNRDTEAMEQQMDKDGVDPKLKQTLSMALGNVEFNVTSFVRLTVTLMNLLILLVVAALALSILPNISKARNQESP